MINLVKKEKSFTGVWKGYYSYDDDPEFAKTVKIPFRLELQQNSFGKITGTVQDDASAGGVEELATIAGYINNGSIYFEKTIPDVPTGFEDGERPEDAGNEYVIHYKGAFDYGKNTFSGTWLIEGMLTQTGGKEYKMDDTKGTWGMERG